MAMAYFCGKYNPKTGVHAVLPGTQYFVDVKYAAVSNATLYSKTSPETTWYFGVPAVGGSMKATGSVQYCIIGMATLTLSAPQVTFFSG